MRSVDGHFLRASPNAPRAARDEEDRQPAAEASSRGSLRTMAPPPPQEPHPPARLSLPSLTAVWMSATMTTTDWSRIRIRHSTRRKGGGSVLAAPVPPLLLLPPPSLRTARRWLQLLLRAARPCW